MLSWAPSSESDLAGYNLYRSTSAEGEYIKVNPALITCTSYLDIGLAPNSDYYYKLSALDRSDNESVLSDAVNVKTFTIEEAFPVYLRYGGIVITSEGSYERIESGINDNSLQSAWVEKIEFLDKMGNLVNSASGTDIFDSNQLKPGEGLLVYLNYPLGFAPDISGWQVRWHCLDAEGEAFVAIATIPDTTAPLISNVAASNITKISAIITWTIDEPATSQVEYGLTTAYGTTTTLDSTLVTSHSVTLSGLSADTTYHYRVKSRGAAGNEAVSEDNAFTTAQPTLDTLTVHFIDVGQGDSILIDLGDIEVLIDGGGKTPGVTEYLNNYVDGALEVMIATQTT
jgi:hypothetical protein